MTGTVAGAAPRDAGSLDVSDAGALSATAVLARLGSAKTGLSDAEAGARLRSVGPNALRVQRVTAWGVLVQQLRNPLLILLLAAAAVSG